MDHGSPGVLLRSPNVVDNSPCGSSSTKEAGYLKESLWICGSGAEARTYTELSDGDADLQRRELENFVSGALGQIPVYA